MAADFGLNLEQIILGKMDFGKFSEKTRGAIPSWENQISRRDQFSETHFCENCCCQMAADPGSLDYIGII